ncbi:MAG TPA: hypothetical protein VLI46_10625 [Ramlibacter sp.]|nr:hypothetical protein [Ramlibacter sp.]
MERILGPIKGYYIASCTCQMGELGKEYLGFAKVCLAKPVDFRSAQSLSDVSSDAVMPTAQGAMERAELRARIAIANMSACVDTSA